MTFSIHFHSETRLPERIIPCIDVQRFEEDYIDTGHIHSGTGSSGITRVFKPFDNGFRPADAELRRSSTSSAVPQL